MFGRCPMLILLVVCSAICCMVPTADAGPFGFFGRCRGNSCGSQNVQNDSPRYECNGNRCRLLPGATRSNNKTSATPIRPDKAEFVDIQKNDIQANESQKNVVDVRQLPRHPIDGSEIIDIRGSEAPDTDIERSLSLVNLSDVNIIDTSDAPELFPQVSGN
jgi:hypothetical protein